MLRVSCDCQILGIVAWPLHDDKWYVWKVINGVKIYIAIHVNISECSLHEIKFIRTILQYITLHLYLTFYVETFSLPFKNYT